MRVWGTEPNLDSWEGDGVRNPRNHFEIHERRERYWE